MTRFHVNMRSHVLVCVFGIFVGFLAGSWWVGPVPPSGFWTDAERAAQLAYWQARIEDVGGSAAYRELSHYAAALTEGGRHTVAHIFGGALYAHEGFAGLGACDSQFSFGCFHEFMGEAIRDNGLGVVAKLNDECQRALSNNPLACQHGIGHGIQAYIGYDRASLDTGLALCKNLPHNDPIGGCYAGAFMEYNTRTMNIALGYRPVEDENLFAPCDTLSPTYEKACAFWQPQWWLGILYSGQATPTAYARMGGLCDVMTRTSAATRSCYEGLGTIAPVSVNGSVSEVVALCKAVSHSSLNQLYCLSYAANDMSSVFGVAAAERVCDGLTGDSADYCLSYANNASNDMRPGVPPDLQ